MSADVFGLFAIACRPNLPTRWRRFLTRSVPRHLAICAARRRRLPARAGATHWPRGAPSRPRADSGYSSSRRSPCCRSSWRNARHLPDGRSRAGDRHLKFHDARDNLVTRTSNLDSANSLPADESRL